MWAEGPQLLYLVMFNFLPSLSCTVVGLPRFVLKFGRGWGYSYFLIFFVHLEK